MARRRKVALDVPATADEARKLLEEYVSTERAVAELKLVSTMSIDTLKNELADAVAPLLSANVARFDAIKAWWEAGGKELAGKGRSAEVGGAKLGFRIAPPAVKIVRGFKIGDVVQWLKGWADPRANGLLRTKEELDKQALIKAAQDDDTLKAVLKDRGVTVVRLDEFYIDTGFDEETIRKELTAPEV